jgi:hypothetical protein
VKDYHGNLQSFPFLLKELSCNNNLLALVNFLKHKDTGMESAGIFCNDLSLLVEKSKQKAASEERDAINMLFWHVGTLINNEILHNKQAEHGEI